MEDEEEKPNKFAVLVDFQEGVNAEKDPNRHWTRRRKTGRHAPVRRIHRVYRVYAMSHETALYIHPVQWNIRWECGNQEGLGADLYWWLAWPSTKYFTSTRPVKLSRAQYLCQWYTSAFRKKATFTWSLSLVSIIADFSYLQLDTHLTPCGTFRALNSFLWHHFLHL